MHYIKKYSTDILGAAYSALGTAGTAAAFSGYLRQSVPWYVIPLTAVLAAVIYVFRKKYFMQLAAVLAAALMLVLINREALSEVLESGIDETADIGLILFLISAGFAELYAFFLYVIKKPSAYAALVLGICIFCTAKDADLSLFAMAALTLSVTGIFSAHITKSFKVCAAVTIFTAAVFSAAYAVTDYADNSLFKVIYKINNRVYRISQSIANEGLDYDTGKVSRGNAYHRGEERLEVWLSDKPNESIYLKGFEGGSYVGGKWESADESGFFDKISFDRGYPRWGSYINTMYREIYYTANRSCHSQIERQSRTITINPLAKKIENRYYPYVSRWERLALKGDDAADMAYVLSYYELSDLDINPDALDEASTRMYSDMQNTYSPYVYENYLYVPEDIVPKLAALCRQNNPQSTDEATELIADALDGCTYTEMPGTAPSNEDIVEYFLFESKKGYCVHFAAAAVLMYRMYGIPARYVTGYRLDTADFEQQKREYYAKALDTAAHAWAEIYVENKGWIPVDFTPSIGGASQNIGDNAVINANESEDTDIEDDINTDIDIQLIRRSAAARKNRNRAIAAAAAAAVIAVLLFVRHIKIKSLDERKYFGKIIKIISTKNNKYTGLEEDFDKILQNKADIAQNDAKRLIDIVYKSAYGGQKADKNELEFVKNLYKQVLKNSIKRLFKRKK